jgi:hypothetical protein
MHPCNMKLMIHHFGLTIVQFEQVIINKQGKYADPNSLIFIGDGELF